MKRIIPIVICLLVFVSVSPFGYGLDRFTLRMGDIFLGTIVDTYNSRYHIERYGSTFIIPTWEVKQIEKNQSSLPMSSPAKPIVEASGAQVIIVPSVFRISKATRYIAPSVASTPLNRRFGDETPYEQNVRVFELMGKQIPIISAPPAEPSHLEMYSKRNHFYSPKNRYMRGYLVNQTERAYRSLRVEIVYYTHIPGIVGSATEPHNDFRQQTEIFDVYPMTMKPFIVDAQFVEWEKVKQIGMEVIGRKPGALP